MRTVAGARSEEEACLILRRIPLLAALCLVVSTLVAFVAPQPTAEAAATVPFASRKTFNDNGAIALIGNNLCAHR